MFTVGSRVEVIHDNVPCYGTVLGIYSNGKLYVSLDGNKHRKSVAIKKFSKECKQTSVPAPVRERPSHSAAMFMAAAMSFSGLEIKYPESIPVPYME